MNGNDFLLDTNIVLLLLGGKLNEHQIPDGTYFISFVTELELLSYPTLTRAEESLIKKFIKSIDIIDINSQIKEKTIAIRERYNLKLPDAIIAATAHFLDAPLVTFDKDFRKVKEIKILFPRN